MSRLENLVLGIIEKKAKKDEHTENFKKHIFEDGNINPNTLSSLKIDIDKKRVNLDGLNIDENQLNSIYIRTFIASLNKIIQEAYNRGYQD